MTLRRCTPRPWVLALALTLAASAGSRAQVSPAGDWLQLGTWEGSLETRFGIGRDTSSTGSLPAQTFSYRNSNELLTLRDSFVVLDPGLVGGNIGLTFGLQQNRSGGTGASESSRNGVLDYAFDSAILSALPYNGTLFANRSRSITNQPFGRLQSLFENRGVSMRLSEASPLRDLGFPYLSANLRLNQQHTQETSSSALGQTFQTDERRTTLTHDGHKGYETADLDWRYEFNRSTNQLTPSANFTGQAANLDYSLDFGPTQNWRWVSRLADNVRRAGTPFSMFNANESLRIDHDSRLATSYSYLVTRVHTASGVALSRSGTAGASYRFFQNLVGQASVAEQVLPSGKIDTEAVALNYAYQQALSGGGRFSARLGAGLLVTDSRVAGAQLGVVGELQTAPAALGAGAGFFLKQIHVTQSTIEVVDLRGGARLPTVLGTDYEVVVEGDQIKIVPLLTSAVIQAGDPLELNYTYKLDPSLKYSTRSDTASLGLDYGWIAINVEHQQSDQRPLSGSNSNSSNGSFLQDVRNDILRLDLRGNWTQLQLVGGASAQRYDATLNSYHQRRLYQNTAYRATRNFGLGLNLEWTGSDYSLPSHQEDARTEVLTMDWYNAGGWMTSASLSRRDLVDSRASRETVTSALMRTQLRYGRLFIMSSLTYNLRLRGDSRLNGWNANLNLTRDF